MDLSIEVSRGSVFLNGTPVTTVLDSRSCAWFKSNDIAGALGFSNASSSVTQRISPEQRCSFKDLHLHEDSPCADAHSRNIFISQKGLISFLSDRYPGASLTKLQNAGQLLRGRSVKATRARNVSETSGEGAIANRPFEPPENLRASPVLDGSGVLLMLNGDPLPYIADVNKNPWFKANDVAMVLGLSNASSSVTIHVSEPDKTMFKNISLHKHSPLLDAHPRNIFINQNGLASVLSAKRRTPLAVDVTVQFPSDPVTRGDKILLNAIYGLFKTLNGSSLSQSMEKTSPSSSTAMAPILADAQPQMQHRAKPCFANGSIIIKDLQDPSDDVYKLFAVEILSDDYLVMNDVVWVKNVHEAPKLLDLIKYFLSAWELRTATYRLALEPLTDMVAKICSNFEKTIDFISKYSPRNNVIPQRISEEQINKIISEPNISEWIYIASCERYIKRNVFKVGHTTRLKKRIEGYRTGRLEEDFLYYVKVMRVRDSKKIDHLISVFLNSWSQKIQTETRINKTEMYMLDFDSVCKFVSKIIDLFDDSHDYVQAHESTFSF